MVPLSPAAGCLCVAVVPSACMLAVLHAGESLALRLQDRLLTRFVVCHSAISCSLQQPMLSVYS